MLKTKPNKESNYRRLINMSKQAPFLSNEKKKGKNISASWRQKRSQQNICSPPHKTQFQQQYIQTIRAKSLPTPSIEKRRKDLKNSKKVDISTSESTYLSEIEKMSNLLALKTEINEWKNQKTLRSKVINILGTADSSKNISEISETKTILADSLKSDLIENRQNYKGQTSDPIDVNQDKESEQLVKMIIQKPGNEKTHSVTWIAMQPTISTSTSLKNVSEYLFEMEQPPMTNKRLCTSPETLNVLECARKLIKDVEQQISEVHLNNFVIEDLETDKIVDNKSNDNENMYIQNIVASTFHKGFYDPALSKTLKKEQLKSNFRLTEMSKLKEATKVHKSIKTARELQMSIDQGVNSNLEELNVSPNIEDCPVCKSSKIEQFKEIHDQNDKILESYNIKKIINKEIDKKPLEKLNMQKGPSISIKGDFSVQMIKTVSIEPDEIAHQISKKSFENVGLYEFCHKSCKNEISTLAKRKTPQPNKKPEKMICHKISILDKQSNDPNIKYDVFKLRKHERKYDNTMKVMLNKKETLLNSKNLIPDDYINIKRNNNSNKQNNIPILHKQIVIDLEEFNLKEPQILARVDLLLNQQQRVIQQVHEATEKFNYFLAYAVPMEKFLTLNKKNDLIICNNKEKNIKNNNEMSDNKNHSLIKYPTKTKRNNDIYFNEFVDINCSQNSFISHEFNKFEIIQSDVEEILIDSNDKQRNENHLVDSKAIKNFCRIIKHSSEYPILTKQKSFIQKLIDVEDIENFDSINSVNTIGSKSNDTSLPVSKFNVQKKDLINELSSNDNLLVQNLNDIEIKSNTNFIENIKQALISKSNNLEVNIYQNYTKRKNQVIGLVQNTKTDENLKLNIRYIGTKTQKDIYITNSISTAYNQCNDNFTLDKLELNCNESRNYSKEIIEHQKQRADTEALQDHFKENSQQTSHLIENISISSQLINENFSDSEDSFRPFSKSGGNIHNIDNASKMKKTMLQEQNNKKFTESKIEKKLYEARNNLNGLMKSMNNNCENSNNINIKSNDQANDLFKNSSYNFSALEVPIKLENNVGPNIIDISYNGRLETNVISLGNIIPLMKGYNFSNTRSFVSTLKQNSDLMLKTVQQYKLNLLKKLESCCIPSHYKSKQFFTSAILDNTELPNSYSKLKTSSETSSEILSEGEISLSSSASYSLGEIRS